MSITKPSSLFLFVQRDENFLEVSTKVEETCFLTIFGNKYMRENRSQLKNALKLIAIHTGKSAPQFK